MNAKEIFDSLVMAADPAQAIRRLPAYELRELIRWLKETSPGRGIAAGVLGLADVEAADRFLNQTT
jgi:hypothetical protein